MREGTRAPVNKQSRSPSTAWLAPAPRQTPASEGRSTCAPPCSFPSCTAAGKARMPANIVQLAALQVSVGHGLGSGRLGGGRLGLGLALHERTLPPPSSSWSPIGLEHGPARVAHRILRLRLLLHEQRLVPLPHLLLLPQLRHALKSRDEEKRPVLPLARCVRLLRQGAACPFLTTPTPHSRAYASAFPHRHTTTL